MGNRAKNPFKGGTLAGMRSGGMRAPPPGAQGGRRRREEQGGEESRHLPREPRPLLPAVRAVALRLVPVTAVASILVPWEERRGERREEEESCEEEKRCEEEER